MKIFREERWGELVCRTKVPILGDDRFHWHENIEICQIKSPKCSFYIDGQRVDARLGDIVAMGEYVIHSYVSEDSDARVRLCQFPLHVLILSKKTIQPIQVHIKAEELSAYPGLAEKVNAIFDMMEEEGYSKKSVENPYLAHLSASLYFLLMKHFPARENTSRVKKDRYEFYRIIEYINENFIEDITVNSIAKTLCISRTKLSSLFGKFAEIGVNSYINTLRINHVNQLIDNGKEITEAAFSSGFRSTRTFNEVYKRLMHMTPSEYLKRNTKKDKI